MNNYHYREDSIHYDDQVKEYNSYGHDVLFGMSYDLVNKNESILDLGIGTGLNSNKFASMGLRVTGIDISKEMLEACEQKQFAEELVRQDFYNNGIPFKENSFNHTVCCGVIHFFDELDMLFNDVKRVTKPNGIWGFSYSPNYSGKQIEEVMTSWGVPIYKHSEEYINKLLLNNNITLLKEQRLLLKSADKKSYDMEFSVVISKI